MGEVRKLSDVKYVEPVCKSDHHCPCGTPKDCLCDLRNVRRVLNPYFCGRCQCEECECTNPIECYRECRTTNDAGGELCICEAICTCDVQNECQLSPTGCICIPECTCGWNEYCNMTRKGKILFGRCSCEPECPCANKEDCFQIPHVYKFADRTSPCVCGAKCPCEDIEDCYFQQVKKKDVQMCVCGSGLYFSDCPCYNKEYCFQGEWPPCACGDTCNCPNRETCFLLSRMAKCKYCDQKCACGYKEFCHKIKEKKERCVCGLLTACKCFNQDQCLYTDKLIRVPLFFPDTIGWRIKPIKRILPLKYEKYNPDGSFKTPYSTSVMIKFLSETGQILYKHPFQITANVNELRRDLSIIFKLPLQAVVLKSHGDVLHQTLIIAELGYKPYDVVELFFDVKEPLVPMTDYYVMVIPDIITVRIQLEKYIHKDIAVEVYDKRIKKPFLGGHRNKHTGLEYHHAWTQTGLRASKISHEYQNNRDTQTYWWRNRLQETTYSRGTQMTNEDIWIPNIGDRIMSYSGYYEDSETWEQKRGLLGKILTIQRYWRAYKMRQALHQLHEEYWQRVRNEEIELEELAEIDRRLHQEELIRKTYPRTRADFAMLYGMLAKWKKAETERISTTYTKSARVAELYLLLQREVKLLNLIERHRREVREDMSSQKDIDFLEELSAPVKWTNDKFQLIQMHTEKTQRAERYKELYFALCRRDLQIDHRLTLLLSLKYALESHRCRQAQEITDLIDQECELLVHGFNELDMLRKRLQLAVLEHVKTSQCDDCLVKRYRGLREIHMDTELLYCIRCEKMKFRHEFPIHSRVERYDVCTICSNVDLTLNPNIDIMPYRNMMNLMIRQERKLNTPACIIYLINERDIQYIVDRIWHGHSLLTETNDLYNLRLERWMMSEPWSPWNTMLVAKPTAEQHVRLENPLEVYGEHVMNDVKNKNLLGRKKFVQMYYINEFFMQTGEMKDYKETIKFTPVPSEIFCNELCTEPDRDAPCVSEKCLTSNDPRNNVRKRIID